LVQNAAEKTTPVNRMATAVGQLHEAQKGKKKRRNQAWEKGADKKHQATAAKKKKTTGR